ncbi:MAG: metallopeptidase TldD-related protein [Bryobacteraceae bacterium]
MMSSRLFPVALVAVSACLVCAADTSKQLPSDVQIRAMQDELARSKTLALSNLDKPYFIQYTTSDTEEFTATATLGGLISSTAAHIRQPRIDIRVGGYDFDNTNSVYSGHASFGLFPLDDNYAAMRSILWAATDSLYKSSADQISRKRNALREIAGADKTPDFARATPVQMIEPTPAFKIDAASWQELVRNLSAVFTAHESITASQVRFRSISSTYRLVNTEGTILRVPQQLSDLSITASALAPDGTRIWNHHFLTGMIPAQLPSPETLHALAQKTAEETDVLLKAPKGEQYAGPVLFEGEASAQMVAQVLTDALRLQRKPLAPPGSNSPATQMIDSVWEARLGSKVVPEWLSISDDPTQETFEGVVLAGQYRVDDEGVPVRPLVLVDKGILKDFLLSRQPVRKFNGSNGHGRLPGRFGNEEAVIGNLFVEAQGGVPEDQLRQRLIDKVKTAGLKYGLIIRRLDFPSTSNFQELQSLARQMQKSGFGRTLNAPLLAYKVYPDGREELIRGLRFGEFSAKDLRDIAAVSSRRYVLNYVNNGTSLNMADVASDATSSSVIAPSMLFDSVDLTPAENEGGRLPTVPPPSLVSQ